MDKRVTSPTPPPRGPPAAPCTQALRGNLNTMENSGCLFSFVNFPSVQLDLTEHGLVV